MRKIVVLLLVLAVIGVTSGVASAANGAILPPLAASR